MAYRYDTQRLTSAHKLQQASKLKINEEQEGLLPQTDRASTFVVDRVKICLTSSLITVQNLVIVSHTICTHAGGPKNLGDAGAPPPSDRGVTVP